MAYCKVVEDEGEDALELPLEDDDTLPLSTLTGQFANSIGLKYRATSGAFRALKLVDAKIHPPPEGWTDLTFVAVFPKENTKRKMDEQNESSGASKQKRIESKKKCTDLIVLGLPYKTTEDELKEYFEQFGEVTVSQIKKEGESGKSRGFGFIRFADYDSQVKVLSQRHQIEGRWCDVKIPDSKGGSEAELNSNVANRKIFVGRITESMTSEELKKFFSEHGEVVDVYISKPFRAFAFVTFADAETAQRLCGEEMVIQGTSVHISSATPKPKATPPGQHYEPRADAWMSPMAPAGGGYAQAAGYSDYAGGGYHSPQAAGYYPTSRSAGRQDGGARGGQYAYSPYGEQSRGRAAAGGGGSAAKQARTSPWLNSAPPRDYYDGANYQSPQQQMAPPPSGPPQHVAGPPTQMAPGGGQGLNQPVNLATGTNQATLGMGALNINPLLNAVLSIQQLLSASQQNPGADMNAMLSNYQAGVWPQAVTTAGGPIPMNTVAGPPPSSMAPPTNVGPPRPINQQQPWS